MLFKGKEVLFSVSLASKAMARPLGPAHLTQDISVFYTIEGRNPTVIKLFGVFSHADSGTGTPSNIKRQQAVGKQMKNQVF